MFSYDVDLGTSLDIVRFLVRDTVESGHKVEDEEITWALTQHSNVYRAAALVAETLAGGGMGIVRKRVGDVEIEYDAGVYRSLAGHLYRQAVIKSAMPSAGGISKAAKQVAEEDTDHPPPFFDRDMMTVPGTTVNP